MKGIFTMNKLTSTLLFAGALLLGGCSHTKTQPVVAAAPPVVTAPAPAPVASGPVDQVDDGPQPHGAPFKGPNWSLTASDGWIGMESENGSGMVAINPEAQVKALLISEPTMPSLTVLASKVSKSLTDHEVKVSKRKNIIVNGTKGVELTTTQGGLIVYVSLFETSENSFLFGCAGQSTNKGAAKTCLEVRNQLHFNK